MNKVVDCLVGLQWGSEGKGKIAAYLASEYKAMVRSGGPQAGHTFYHQGKKYINRQIPCGVINPDCKLYFSPAGLVDLNVLQGEIKRYQLSPSRLLIDRQALVVTAEHKAMEREASLEQRIGSTREGVGAAQAEKIWRRGILMEEYLRQRPELFAVRDFVGDTTAAVHSHLQQKQPVLLEGTQGFGLCLNHGTYPYVTSRDVTAAALLNDAGIPPSDHRFTIGVLRTYPIRVGGNSGPTGSKELAWEEITVRSGSSRLLQEYTTVTGRLRRVFEQDYCLLQRAILVNKPDYLALLFLDYITIDDFGKKAFEELTPLSRKYIQELEEKLQTPILLIGTGPEEHQLIDRRDKKNKK